MTNILLVEDEPLIAEEIRQTLLPAGYAVINGFNESAPDATAFATGVNRLIDNLQAAVVLMDINLAGKFDGVEIGRRVREKSKVPFIFLTGYSDAATLTRALGTSPSGYLIKPISGRQLLAQIELTLRQTGTRKEHEERIKSQAGLWNLKLTTDNIGGSFGWLTQFRYLRDAISTFDEFRKIVHPQDEEALYHFLANCRSPEKNGAQIEYRLLNADGHERWILTKILQVETAGEVVSIEAINFDISEQKEKELQLQHRATHDSLTNLHNRSHFMAELQAHAALQTEQSSYAVLFADLDKFKPVNDTFGHACGDRLLVEVARRFQRAVKRSDLVARFGGDEFVFLIKGLRNERDLQKISRRILSSLSDPIRIDDKTIRIGCSLGAALNIPRDKSTGQMLHDADVALYAAKKSTHDKFKLYEANDKSRVFAQLMTAEAMRNAVKQNQFVPYFNPFMRAGQQRIAGIRIEAHWIHPVHGSIPFADYHEAAEESGLIVPITLKLLESVLELLRGSAAAKDHDFILVPLSRRLLLLRDWPAIVSMASEQYTEAGLSLVFEFDEAGFSRPQNRQLMQQLQTSGVNFCLNLENLPEFHHSLAEMPFRFVSLNTTDGKSPEDTVAFCQRLNEAGKLLIVQGRYLKNKMDFQAFGKYVIFQRKFPLIRAKRNKSDQAAGRK